MSTSQHTGHSAPTSHPIRYVPRHEIDTARWDACIARADNSLIYGFHFYLDHMADGHWDALVLGDYEAVMPLTWRRKYGIRYLYQPPFTQQTGIFSPHPIPPGLIEAFLQTTRDRFRFAEIFLNYKNAHPILRPKKNFILDLDAPYPRIAAHYRPHLTRNLRNAAHHELRYSDDVDLPAALDGYRRTYGDRTPHVVPKDYEHFEQLCRQLQKSNQLILRVVTAPAQTATDPAHVPSNPAPTAIDPAHVPTNPAHAPLATALLARDNHRLYLLQPVTYPAGRKISANHFLLDQLIREFAGQPLLLDFEGSELPGVAQFYENFGSIEQPYYFYRYNHLPLIVNIFKTLTNRHQ